jgi:hypothetical protein
MIRTGTTIAALALALGQPVALAQTATPLDPAQAIAAAASASKGEVEGVFEFQVASTGASGFNVYLNSAADYRDPANLSAELHPGALAVLRKALGGEPEDLLKGKRVRVTGTARRVPIPRRDSTPYYQTRIDVDRDDQIRILD